MHLCKYCTSSTLDGKGCLHPVVSRYIGNKFPTGISINHCTAFVLRLDKSADVTLKCGEHQIKYNINKKNHYEKRH